MKFDKIIVAGGGSAGWMTAATLIRTFPDKEITVIESPDVPIIGVGESTIDGIKLWTKYLGLNEKEFLKETNGTYKLSIRFDHFWDKQKMHQINYVFGPPNLGEFTLNDWWYKKYLKEDTKFYDYACSFYPQMALINRNVFTDNKDNLLPFDFDKHSAYHFDAVKFGNYLKTNYCLPRGVKHIVEDIKSVETDETGIKSLNNKHKADLYFDCTGQKSLLLGEALKEKFIDYSHLLPNNSAWATKKEYGNKRLDMKPYTRCTAGPSGWVWEIPLYNRIGTGYVFSDKHSTDEEALNDFKWFLDPQLNEDGEPIISQWIHDLEYKLIKFRTGIHKRPFVKNVCAIGMAAGFIEPLESNGLFTVHDFLMKFVGNMTRGKVSQWDRDSFNFACRDTYHNFAEFVALHYALSHRDDTKYWQDIQEKSWSEEMNELKPTLSTGIFKAAYDKNKLHRFDTFGGLHQITAGFNWSPEPYEIAMFNQNLNEEEFRKEHMWKSEKMDKRVRDWHDIVIKAKLKTMYEWLKENIHEDSTT